MFLGIPFNIASASLLVYILAHHTGLKPGFLTIHIGDAHIYENHILAVKTQMERETFAFPTLQFTIEPLPNIEDYTIEDFILENYESHPAITAEMIA
jgi:thymidylate synthase